MSFSSHSEVAIIGAGPYGVSIASHLQSAGIDFRIFGTPIERWRTQMPKGMFLKSDGCASSLSDPAARHTLAQYCADHGLPYGERGTPVALDVFTRYALSFQRKYAPNVEEVIVTDVEKSREAFHLRLADGTRMSAGKVVVATGLAHAAHIPSELAPLPPELLSHCENHHDLSIFRERDVTVIGAGQSALEAAALLHEAGASVRVLVRRPSLAWNQVPATRRRSLYQRLRYPSSQLGDGLQLWLCCNVPMLFRQLPERIRFDKVKTVLGPAGAWWLRDRVVGKVQILLGHALQKAGDRGGRAVLQVAGQDGRTECIATDHVIAATGYRFDLQRLPFLSPSLKSKVRTAQGRPLLSSAFESSAGGLYFTSLASAGSFGPAMRFLHGADYTARRVCHHIASGGRERSSPPVYDLARAAE